MVKEIEKRHYLVTWTIDAWATSPEAAAEFARDAQTRPDTTALIFDVEDTSHGLHYEVDLMRMPV